MSLKHVAMEQNRLATAHHEYQKKLLQHAYYKLHDYSKCEDLVQDTFMKAWNYFLRGGKIELMRSFLFHILDNLIVDEYRRHKTCSLDALLEKGFDPTRTNPDNLVNAIDSKLAIDLIKSLPNSYKELMNMRYVEDLSLQEMAKITGLPKNTLAVKLHRGLKQVKSMYEFKAGTPSTV